MTSISDLRPGTVFVTPTYGAGLDKLFGDIIRWGTGSPVNHAGIYVGEGKILQATPSGAVYNDWDAWGSDAIWAVNGIGQRDPDGAVIPIDLTDAQRAAVVDRAKALYNTPYGWLDIVAIGIAQKRAHKLVDPDAPLNKQPWWVRRIQREDRLICSQLVDTAYKNAGISLFVDGRLPGLVSPADLYGLFTP